MMTKRFVRRLAKAMEKRGFDVEVATSVAAGPRAAEARPPAYAVCDLRLEDGNGLDVVEVIREQRPESRIVVSDRLWRHRHGGRCGQDRRDGLPVQACRREPTSSTR